MIVGQAFCKIPCRAEIGILAEIFISHRHGFSEACAVIPVEKLPELVHRRIGAPAKRAIVTGDGLGDGEWINPLRCDADMAEEAFTEAGDVFGFDVELFGNV